MFEVFLAVILEAAVPAILGGYFRTASTNQILRWKLAAWGWLGFSIVSFWSASLLAVPFEVGLAIGAGLFAVPASIVCSLSASILHWRREEARSSCLSSLRSSAPQ